jgi:DNA sulfur modification protein DndB
MRPVVQLAVGRAVRHVVERKLLTWDAALDRLRALDWRIEAAPFNAVWQSTPQGKTKGKMITGKDNQDLLLALLLVHIAPISKAQVTRAINSYKALKGTRYPVTVDTLMTGAVAAPAEASDADIPTKLEEIPEVEDTSPEA